jgi:8-oxo-dGTP diphosphatase
MKLTHSRPQVGIGVIIENEDEVLLGKRLNAHGEGNWSFPGGHLEFGESWEECARREVREETNLEITNVEFFSVTNDFMKCDYHSGKLINLEPWKCEKWQWFSRDNLPEQLFLPIKNLMKTITEI